MPILLSVFVDKEAFRPGLLLLDPQIKDWILIFCCPSLFCLCVFEDINKCHSSPSLCLCLFIWGSLDYRRCGNGSRTIYIYRNGRTKPQTDGKIDRKIKREKYELTCKKKGNMLAVFLFVFLIIMAWLPSILGIHSILDIHTFCVHQTTVVTWNNLFIKGSKKCCFCEFCTLFSQGYSHIEHS